MSSDVPNWQFQTEVLAKALDLLTEVQACLETETYDSFLTDELPLVLQEANDALIALQLHCQQISFEHGTALVKRDRND